MRNFFARVGKDVAKGKDAGLSSTAVRALFDAALIEHKRGALAEAAEGYRAVLGQQPQNSDASYLLGVVQWQQGRTREALDSIARGSYIELRSDSELDNFFDDLITRVDQRRHPPVA